MIKMLQREFGQRTAIVQDPGLTHSVHSSNMTLKEHSCSVVRALVWKSTCRGHGFELSIVSKLTIAVVHMCVLYQSMECVVCSFLCCLMSSSPESRVYYSRSSVVLFLFDSTLGQLVGSINSLSAISLLPKWPD